MKNTTLALMIIVLASTETVTAATTSLRCSYPFQATPEGVSRQDFSFSLILDTTSGKAYMLGNAGSTELAVIKGVGVVTFVEVTEWGMVNTTAVITLDDGKEYGTTASVHSRVPALLGEFVPSQNYGNCEWK
jgi:hypothetical protein